MRKTLLVLMAATFGLATVGMAAGQDGPDGTPTAEAAQHNWMPVVDHATGTPTGAFLADIATNGGVRLTGAQNAAPRRAASQNGDGCKAGWISTATELALCIRAGRALSDQHAAWLLQSKGVRQAFGRLRRAAASPPLVISPKVWKAE